MPAKMKEFSEWITRMFVEWQANQGRRKTVEEFAAFVGVSRPLMNMWMNGNKKPGRENVKILAETFGAEIYDILGIPRPDPDLAYIQAHWNELDSATRKFVKERVQKYAEKNEFSTASKKRTTRISRA